MNFLEWLEYLMKLVDYSKEFCDVCVCSYGSLTTIIYDEWAISWMKGYIVTTNTLCCMTMVVKYYCLCSIKTRNTISLFIADIYLSYWSKTYTNNYPQPFFQAKIWLHQIRVYWRQYATIVEFHSHMVQKTAVLSYIGIVFDT